MWTYLTRIIIFSAEWNVYLWNLFLSFSLSAQLNCSWGYHLGAMLVLVSITQWRVELGIFYTRFFRVSKLKSALLLCNYCTIALYFVCCMVSYLFICGSMELNLWPKITKSSYDFSLCHCNLHMFCRIRPRALMPSLSIKVISSWLVVLRRLWIIISISKIEFKNWILPLYKRLAWEYKNINTQLFSHTIETFIWED